MISFRMLLCWALLVLFISVPGYAQWDAFLWDKGKELPKRGALDGIEGVAFYVIKPWEPEKDGYNWLHGIALAWHAGRLYASFGHNKGLENTAGEEARGLISEDGGKTWGSPFTIDVGDEPELAVSHGVFLEHERKLWAFHGAFYNHVERVHTRAYLLDDKTGEWEKKGTVVEEGFWPMQAPQRMQNGDYIMAGIRIDKLEDTKGNFPAVAISHGDDLSQWTLKVIAPDDRIKPQSIWGESSVLLDGAQVLNIARWDAPIALASMSSDYGETWTKAMFSNLPFAASKPYTGVLSTGQRYLIGTIAADTRNHRFPLTLALMEKGEKLFSRVLRIRSAEHDGPGESGATCALSYPYAVEHEGKLYVAYSNDGERGSNRNSAELAVIPVEALGNAR